MDPNLEFEKTQKYYPTPGDDLTRYDIESIMHYDGTLRDILPIPILTDKITGKSIKINKKMSPLDIEKLNQMYPCAGPTIPDCGKF